MNIIILISTIIGFAITIYALYQLATKLRELFWNINTQINDIFKLLNESKKQVHKLSIDIDTKASETQNAIYLSKLDFQVPVFMGGWSIDTFLGKFLVQHIVDSKPKAILELGAGSSTQIIAKTLQVIGINDHTHIAVDHEAKYLEISRKNANSNGLENKINWLECPLVNYEEHGKIWYGGIVEKLQDYNIKIDLLIIDGPPGNLQKHSRYLALPVLLPFLSENCVVILDDAGREEEQEIANLWVKENPEFSLKLYTEGHGIAVLTKNTQLQEN